MLVGRFFDAKCRGEVGMSASTILSRHSGMHGKAPPAKWADTYIHTTSIVRPPPSLSYSLSFRRPSTKIYVIKALSTYYRNPGLLSRLVIAVHARTASSLDPHHRVHFSIHLQCWRSCYGIGNCLELLNCYVTSPLFLLRPVAPASDIQFSFWLT
jgi:hypothetical protein